MHAGSNSIFEARTFSELSTGLTQAVLAVANSCRETQCVPSRLPRSIAQGILLTTLVLLTRQLDRKECARGAVTCGDHWIFFAYQAPKGNDYAKYARTEVLDIGKGGEDLDLILGILVDWVRYIVI